MHRSVAAVGQPLGAIGRCGGSVGLLAGGVLQKDADGPNDPLFTRGK